jgi:hypothetical protein
MDPSTLMHGIDPRSVFKETMMNQFAEMHNSFLGIQSQLTGLHSQLSGLDKRLSGVESELIAFRSDVNSKFDRVNSKVDRVHEDMQAINHRAIAWFVSDLPQPAFLKLTCSRHKNATSKQHNAAAYSLSLASKLLPLVDLKHAQVISGFPTSLWALRQLDGILSLL